LVPSGQRDEFLRQACAGDAGLEQEVRSLLASDQSVGGFLENPAIKDAAQTIALNEIREFGDAVLGQTISHYRVLKKLGSGGIMVGSIDSKESKLLLHAHASAIYASGHILFLRQNTLMAQPFDLKQLELTGDAFPIGDPVADGGSNLRGVFSASQNGNLTYMEGSSGASRQLIWLDRGAKQIGGVPGSGHVQLLCHLAR
jgi:hypothetical protein